MKLEPLESAAIELLLAGDHPVLASLRTQLASAEIESRDRSAVGFFTHFSVANTAARSPLADFVLSYVDGKIEGLPHGAAFLMFVHDGRLSMLEGVAYAGLWPDTVDKFELRCVDELRREQLAGL